MKNKIISVIVPIYNSEKSLEKCISSILKQSYKYIEILLINDGSTDSSKYICETFQKKDKRIKYIEKDNEGVSKARNVGIKMSSGDYISFIDADDYIEYDMYERMIEASNIYNSDVVICNFVREDEKGNRINKHFKTEPHKDFCFNSCNFLKIAYKYASIDLFLCNKLYSTKIIKHKDNIIKLNEKIAMSEDALFNTQLILNNNNFNCTYINKKLYHYVFNKNSITNQKVNIKKISYLDEKIEEIKMLEDNNMDTNIQKALYVLFYNNSRKYYDSRLFENKLNNYYSIYNKNIDYGKLPFKLKIKYILSKIQKQ